MYTNLVGEFGELKLDILPDLSAEKDPLRSNTKLLTASVISANQYYCEKEVKLKKLAYLNFKLTIECQERTTCVAISGFTLSTLHFAL